MIRVVPMSRLETDRMRLAEHGAHLLAEEACNPPGRRR